MSSVRCIATNPRSLNDPKQQYSSFILDSLSNSLPPQLHQASEDLHPCRRLLRPPVVAVSASIIRSEAALIAEEGGLRPSSGKTFALEELCGAILCLEDVGLVAQTRICQVLPAHDLEDLVLHAHRDLVLPLSHQLLHNGELPMLGRGSHRADVELLCISDHLEVAHRRVKHSEVGLSALLTIARLQDTHLFLALLRLGCFPVAELWPAITRKEVFTLLDAVDSRAEFRQHEQDTLLLHAILFAQ